MMERGAAQSSSLLEAFEDQNEQFAAAFSILQKAIEDRAFPAASIAVTDHGKLVALRTFGDFIYDEREGITTAAVAPPLSRSLRQGVNFNLAIRLATLFDLASLTKVVATTPMAMLLYERGLLDLDAPVSAVIPEFLTDSAKDALRKPITLRMLLSHSSGLPAYEKLFLRAKSRDELLLAAFTTPITADPGSRAEYSDIGFIILGVALERLADESLDRFCQREIFAPLGMTNTCFNPPEQIRSHIPPTQDDKFFRHRIIQGEVQDENAFVLGGVAGHAGLFSTAGDIAKFAHSLLCSQSAQPTYEEPAYEDCHFERADANATASRETLGSLKSSEQELPSKPVFRPETIALFTRRESSPSGTSRALGWDTPSSPSQSGKYFSEESFGHLGYTGTSLWIDPTRQLSVTLLTNRTWPDCSNQAIKQVRPKFHDAIAKAI
jgi:serine-type D-Ala-D-Ala carboxypeptidase